MNDTPTPDTDPASALGFDIPTLMSALLGSGLADAIVIITPQGEAHTGANPRVPVGMLAAGLRTVAATVEGTPPEIRKNGVA